MDFDRLSPEEFAKLFFNRLNSRITSIDRQNVNKTITALGAKMTFKIGKGVIIVIESLKDIQNADFESNFEDLDVVYIKKETIEKYWVRDENINLSDPDIREMRILFVEDCIRQLAKMKKKTFIHHKEKHLSSTKATAENAISLIIKRTNDKDIQRTTKEHCHYCIFDKIDETSLNTPRYNANTPDGFAPFLFKGDMELIEEYHKRKSLEGKRSSVCNGGKPIRSVHPKKEHNFCFICKENFNDYKEHMEFPTHKENSEKKRNDYASLEALFESIRPKRPKEENSMFTSNSSGLSIATTNNSDTYINSWKDRDYLKTNIVLKETTTTNRREINNGNIFANCNINQYNFFIQGDNKKLNASNPNHKNLIVDIYSPKRDKSKTRKSSSPHNKSRVSANSKINKSASNFKEKITAPKENVSISFKEDDRNQFKGKRSFEVSSYRKKRFRSIISPEMNRKTKRLKLRKNNFDRIVEDLEIFKKLMKF